MQTLSDLLKSFFDKDRRALARLISLIENRDPALPEIVRRIYPRTGNAFVLGITGPPGAGKSTVTDKLIKRIRAGNQTVAVVAIDPSSPFTGGAILGDRIRMQSNHQDEGVYIRSLGTRGTHGGLSGSSREVVMAIDAAGFDWILVETAGVGQTELNIMKLADMVCVVLVPESGDGIQVMKAGLMEIADLFVVNKCDRPESDKLVKELVTSMQAPVLKTEALHDRGIDELFSKIQTLQKQMEEKNILHERKKRFLAEEVEEIILNKISISIKDLIRSEAGNNILEALIKKQLNPYDVSLSLLEKIIDKKTKVF